MFECTLAQGDVFRKIVNAISDLVTDGNFQCDASRISFQGMDSSHVSLVSLTLNASGFSPYRCDRDITLGINFQSLNKVLKCMNMKDKLSLRHDENSDVCSFLFESPKEDKLSSFDLKLMDIDTEQLGIPETTYKCVIKMSSVEFQKICRDLMAIGDAVTIEATKEGVKFSVTGDIGSGDMILKNSKDDAVDDDDDDIRTVIKLEEPVTQTFALRYLQLFTKATSLSKIVTISLGTDVPLVTEYRVDDIAHVKYYLAPKIDDEE